MRNAWRRERNNAEMTNDCQPDLATALGLDVGSTVTKLVAVDDGGRICWSHMEATAPHIEQQCEKSIKVGV